MPKPRMARMPLYAAMITALVAGAAWAQQHKPLRTATAEEQKARAAVSIADYRFGDLLFENDRIAFRIYGRPLEAAEPPSSSGIDAWGKRVRWPFMDRQLRTGDQHQDQGEGVDFYNVGTGRGVGGLGIWHDNKLWTSRNYVNPRIAVAGPERAAFSVDYPAWPVDTARTVAETRQFALAPGSNFIRMTSTIASSSSQPLTVAIGISKRPTGTALGSILKDADKARLVWWGPDTPDKGAMAAAVMVDPAAFAGFAEDADNYLILVRVTPGKPFVYHAGAAWSGGPDFKREPDWQAYVQQQQPDFNP
ncbi:DUF4861 domain-containing protein [Sphingomonas sp. J315]|uniref:DUF4861 domain-containing protein n=2 Tax=unclassified Sphingomonas TaxID=196159 RepID=UPI0021AE1625|nr:DUF4861 domain-containing protein [Sphingomonas sp. J315]UUX98981.1 DUF4861 domain-containing protein [Sphingomonas sp. J315]